jgi:bacterioferritin (cytochrome b1)
MTIDDLEKTDAYKSMNLLQKKVVRKHNNVKEIQHALNVIENIGFEDWEKKFKTTYLNILIIKNICNER